LANDLQSDPEVITLPDGRRLPLKCATRFISFSAHSDYGQTREFIAATRTPHVILVHGEQNLMRRLRDRLAVEFPHISCSNPQNTQTVELTFPSGKLLGEAVGAAATILEKPEISTSSLLLVEDSKIQGLSANSGVAGIGALVVTPEDLNQFANVSAIKAKFTQRIDGLPVPPSVECVDYVKSLVEDIFDDVQSFKNKLSVENGLVDIQAVGDTVWVSWFGSPQADVTADAISLVLLNARKEVAAVQPGAMKISKNVEAEKSVQMLSKLIEMNYGEIKNVDQQALLVQAFDGSAEVVVDVAGRTVTLVKGDAQSAKKLQDLVKAF
jgi:cleavage and polyadenylation specificity factor subunit 3